MQDHTDLTKLIFGRLSWDAIPFHEPILLVTFAMVILGGIAVLGGITYFRLWGTLWRDWITSIDHKKIGIMYMILGLIMLMRGFADALMMRAQQAIAFGMVANSLMQDNCRAEAAKWEQVAKMVLDAVQLVCHDKNGKR